MTIDDNVLAKLEKLSALHIEDSKREEVKEQLTSILSYIDNLNELDTDGLDSSFSTLQGGTPLRKDISRGDSDIGQKILSRAPKSQDDFFVVPAIIE